MAKYVFDSNIFINLQRRQPIDIFPSLWNRIGDLMDEGTIISSQEVYDEIINQGFGICAFAGPNWTGDEIEYFFFSHYTLPSISLQEQ